MVKICPTCKKFVPETAPKCPICGNTKLVLANVPASTAAKPSPTTINTKQEKKKSKAPIAVSLIAILIVVAVAFFAKNNLPFGRVSGSSSTSSIPSHRTQNTQTPTPEPKGEWEIRYYVDEFNQPTSEAYITNANLVRGTFSNTATTDSKLYVRFLISENLGGDIEVAIKLYEYGNIEVKNPYSHSIDYNITMLEVDGTKKHIDGSMYSDRLKIQGPVYLMDGTMRQLYNHTEDVINALKDNGQVSFYITEEDRRTTEYLFTVRTLPIKDKTENNILLCSYPKFFPL